MYQVFIIFNFIHSQMKGSYSMTIRLINSFISFFCALAFFLFADLGLAIAQDPPSFFTNSLGMEFVLIPAGTFFMGADKNFESANYFELPRHKVRISRPFYFGAFEVTQQEWVTVMGDNISSFKKRENPVNMASWEDAHNFIDRLNQLEGHFRYRLPTEAEWEYATRAGSTSAYFFGDDYSELENYAWYGKNSGDSLHPVGQKLPNGWGLFDILGNVDEWTEDWFAEDYYANSPSTDPNGPATGEGRVIRGCNFEFDSETFCRSADRGMRNPAEGSRFLGFRLALSVE
jgi:formylglycine-generating enzyme required for sulfatase activity